MDEPNPREPCPSVNTLYHTNRLIEFPCTLPLNHRGLCHDRYGGTWLRLSESLRQDREGRRGVD